MRKILLAALLAISAVTAPAWAHWQGPGNCRPYWVVLRCDADMPSCRRARMFYKPGNSLADNPRGSYFYASPPYESHHRHRHRGLYFLHWFPVHWHHHSWSLAQRICHSGHTHVELPIN